MVKTNYSETTLEREKMASTIAALESEGYELIVRDSTLAIRIYEIAELIRDTLEEGKNYTDPDAEIDIHMLEVRDPNLLFSMHHILMLRGRTQDRASLRTIEDILSDYAKNPNIGIPERGKMVLYDFYNSEKVAATLPGIDGRHFFPQMSAMNIRFVDEPEIEIDPKNKPN